MAHIIFHIPTCSLQQSPCEVGQGERGSERETETIPKLPVVKEEYNLLLVWHLNCSTKLVLILSLMES